MRRLLRYFVSAVIVVLCLLALDDITTGRESHFYLEWTMVALGVMWFGGLALARARRWRGS